MTRRRSLCGGSGATVLALCALALDPQAAPASDRASADSVVKIICTLEGGGEATATGFVWPEPRQVVTALHAVAGCADVSIWSEATGFFDQMTRILSVDLEADLALIEMADGLGLPAVPLAPDPPDMRAEYFAWGYPLVTQEMIDLEVRFAGGRKAGVTTLGAAFRSAELDDLFGGQDYPTPDTSILRVGTTLQPGQSGAPIFDGDGNVVAIVDGGLLGGWRGINWSVPAYLYLPDLPASADPVPDGPSHQAILHSNAAPPAPASVEVGFAQGSPDASREDVLNLVRQIGLRDLGETLRAEQVEAGQVMYDQLVALLDAPEDVDLYSYDIYEDNLSGATIGVPSDLELAWDDELQAVVAATESGAVYYAAAVGLADSFDDAVSGRLDAFAQQMTADVEWAEDGIEPVEDEIDEENESASFLAVLDGHHPGMASDVQMSLGLYVSGPVYLGVSVGLADAAVDPATDPVAYLRAALGAWFLTDFALN